MRRNTHRYFAYQLAVRLGRLNVDRMLRDLTAKQFLGWEEYARLNPLDAPELRADWRMAAMLKHMFDHNQRLVDAVLAAAGAKKSDRPKMIQTKLEDFILQWVDPESPVTSKRKQSWEDQFRIAQLINTAFSAPEGHA